MNIALVQEKTINSEAHQYTQLSEELYSNMISTVDLPNIHTYYASAQIVRPSASRELQSAQARTHQLQSA